MEKILGVNQFLSKKFPVMDFDGKWLSAFGRPSAYGSWIIWGSSGSGKTRFAVQLCKYLTRFGRVAYNSLEEGYSASLQRAFRDVNMGEVSSRVMVWNRTPVAEMRERLKKQKSPDIVITDSFQYTRMTYEDYQELKEAFPRKLFIFVSHADGKDPRGSAAQSVRYDCDVKIRVEGFLAMAASRAGSKEAFTVWKEGAVKYWGESRQSDSGD
jgi:hypothetical protein